MPTTMGPKRKKKPGTVGGNSSLNGSGGNFTESAMDEFLSKQGLYRKPIAKDGSCLFRAVSEQVHNCQAQHLDVRNQCIDFMRRNRAHFEEFIEGPFDHHLFKLQNPKEWAGQVEITALSQIYSKDFVVYQDINSPPTKVTDHGYKDKILLCYSNGNHYDIIYNNQYQEHAAMCQSLLFEVLYNRVFAELDKKEASKKGTKPKGPVISIHSNQRNIMDWVNGSVVDDGDVMDNGGDDDGWTEVKSKARAKHERQTKSVEVEEEKEQEDNKPKGSNDQKNLWELRRSVDPHLYRNIPLEVWEEDKHLLQQKDLSVAASLQFKNGERCSVKLGPPTVPVEKSYNAIIKEDYNGSGSIQVYVQELNKRHTVPIQSVSGQQGPGYKDLSGHYQKDFAANGPPTEEGAKDDNKFKKKRTPRNRRGPAKGGDEAGNATEDPLPRGRGKPRERYNRRRYPGGKDDRNLQDAKDEEEAKFMAEQIKLVELQEKDPAAFPALPIRASPQVSPTAGPPSPKIPEKIEVVTSPVKVEKPQEKEKIVIAVQPDESSPAGFWSRFKKTPKPASDETKAPITPPAVAKQQEPDACDTLTVKVDDESQIHEDVLTEEQLDTVEENKNEEHKETCIHDNQSHPSIIVIDKEIKKPFNEPLQIKPIPDDSKLNRHGPPMFEVKIPETVTSPLQPVKITPTSLKQTQEEPMFQEQPLEVMELVFTQEEPEKKVDEYEETKAITNNDEIEEMAGLAIEDNVDITLPEPFQLPSPNREATLPVDKSLSYQDTDYPPEEPATKAAKPRVSDSACTPERKTVTFAEETKEIPDLPYGQSQKGILIVNGTNKPSQVGDQGYKPSNPDDYTSLTKENSKQDYMNPQDTLDKDAQTFQTGIPSEGLQSSSPTAQQQSQLPPYILPMLPPNVQLPARLSLDPNGADLPQDIPTLRHFFNLGYQHYMMMANQLTNQQMPLMYMYQGTMQDQMMSQAAQPVATMSQQQIYAGMQHQQLAFQHPGMQAYPPPFHLPPQTTQDSTTQLDRTTDRSSQPQIQPQQQIHQQQSGHFQQQQNHMWSSGVRGGSSSTSGGGNSRHYNQHKFQHHNLAAQTNRPWSQGPGSNPRQPHSNNKPNRKPQGGKMRSEQHFNSSSQGQNMAHNAMTPSQNMQYYGMSRDHQSKGHTATEYYQGNTVMYTGYPSMQSGMPNAPHTTGARVNYN